MNHMIRVSQLKLSIPHTKEQLEKKLVRQLHIRPEELISYQIRRQSLDARKKPELFYVYTVDVKVKNEAMLLKHKKGSNVSHIEERPYQVPPHGTEKLNGRPVIVGSGPAGLFCAYVLAKEGYRPLVLERGADVEKRKSDVEHFWETGVLNPDSNVQFGEGGAGTFSDGKLNTLVKDKNGRNRFVLETFVKFGAAEDILYVQKPHIGTDILIKVVRKMREEILRLGGKFSFHSQVTDLLVEQHCLQVNGTEEILAGVAVFAIGHSARDTFEMLNRHQLPMRAKSFAVGVRVEHPQELIDQSQYGRSRGKELPAAAYKLTENLTNGRGVYTFCMCPGGYVVNAWKAGQGKVPVQRFEDFRKNRISTEYGTVSPCIKGAYTLANVREIFPKELSLSLEDGILAMDHKIRGFAGEDVLLSGVESRTSSPVRIERNEQCVSEKISWIYPCGEGAGYAGGITSAAMDGIKVAEEIIRRYES